MSAAMLGSERTQKYDIPLGHLEYSYIRECKDSKELEKIIKILRSGEEGKYPDLETFAEKRLEAVNPKSKVLRKEQPVSKPHDVEKSEWDKIVGDLENWTSEMQIAEDDLKDSQQASINSDEGLPPVRGQSQPISIPKKINPEAKKENQEKSSGSSSKKNKRVKPREYREWDKFDIDAELAKVEDEEDKNPDLGKSGAVNDKQEAAKVKNVLRKASKPPIPEVVDSTGMTDKEKSTKATAEKEKGNEAFRASDFEEALLYYNRSLSLAPTVAAYNNRAQAYLKLKEWDKALSDCQTVLEKDPGNLKGVLRRAVAYQGKQQFTNAKNDLQKVLSAEPTNKRAQDILAEVEKAMSEQKTKGRRMLIQESDGSDTESEGEELKPAKSSKPMMNGVHEKVEETQKATEQTVKAENPHKSATKKDNSKKDKTKDIWEKDEVKDPKVAEQKVQKQATPSTTSPITQNKPFEQPTVKEPEKDCKPEAASKETKSGKANKRKKKGKGRNQNQTSPQPKKTEPQNTKEIKDQSTPAEQVSVTPPEASSDKTVETPSETQKVEEVAVAEPAPPVVEVPPPPPQKPLPPDVVKHKTTGNDLFKVGQYGEAINHYGKGIDVLKKDEVGHAANLAVLYSNQAACKLKVGDCEGCVRDCNSALELSPGGIKPLTRRAQAFEMMEKYRRAYVDFRQVLYLDPSVDVAMQGVNRCMKMLQQVDGPRWREKLPAVSMANLPSYTAPTTVSPVTTPNDAPPTHPPQAPPTSQATPPKTQAPPPTSTLSKEELFDKYKSEGNEFVQKGDYTQAVACYTQCIETLPDRSVPFTNRALCNLRLNKPEDVVTDCNQALVLEPGNIKALFRRAQAYKMLEKYDESFHDLTTLLKKDSKNASARREFQVVINYREQAKKAKLAAEKEKQSAASKPRQRLKIQEVSDSSDSEEDEPPKAKPSNKSKAQKKTAKSEAKPAKSEAKPAKSEAKPAKSEAKSAKSEPKSEAKPAKSEAKIDKPEPKSEAKPAKSEEDSPKSEAKPAKNEAKSAKSDSKSKKPSKTEKGSSNEKPTDQSPTSPKSESAVPTLVNKTPYEFLQAWTGLRTNKDPALYAKLLEQIEPEELPKVVSNKLDGDMLHMIIKCVEMFLDKGIEQGAPQPSLFSRSLAYLQQLTSVPRFSMVTMFMGDKEKKDLERVLRKLSEGASCQYLQDDLTKLRKTYEL